MSEVSKENIKDNKEKKPEVGEFISDPEPIYLVEDKWKEFWLLNFVDHYR